MLIIFLALILCAIRATLPSRQLVKLWSWCGSKKRYQLPHSGMSTTAVAFGTGTISSKQEPSTTSCKWKTPRRDPLPDRFCTRYLRHADLDRYNISATASLHAHPARGIAPYRIWRHPFAMRLRHLVKRARNISTSNTWSMNSRRKLPSKNCPYRPVGHSNENEDREDSLRSITRPKIVHALDRFLFSQQSPWMASVLCSHNRNDKTKVSLLSSVAIRNYSLDFNAYSNSIDTYVSIINQSPTYVRDFGSLSSDPSVVAATLISPRH
ncbi:hypothetical protein DE146DRAFT_34840 [Phaeosphaeria sp. MPI-PUGE-AT-0046c]|nr:hypothetical protein DE146DRAFT_34840 [Phaeosphaeria sp. MPI-PUGE-AT-0046c]